MINVMCFRTFYTVSYTGPRMIGANVMNFGLKHAPGAGSITWLVDVQSRVLPLTFPDM